ncbi:MAG TPA: acylphosphatase [Candidatus Kapabacteria bacterium]|nr:acylphosphatase [Candidatus Kapabacteria bacterium]
MLRLHITVHGIVQGVGYRRFVKTFAKRLELGGFARNLPDGSVEIEAEGLEHNLAAFIQHVERGPSIGKVTSIESRELPLRHETEFVIEYD